jgi:predicted anti-sigma-YlaC factor YlaD
VSEASCERFQDALSARLDGEAPPTGLDAEALDAHVAGCAACSAFRVGATAQHRALRVRAAEPVPDLTQRILERLPAASRPQPVREWARYALFAVAATQLVLALPAVLLGEDPGASIHVARELGSFDIALAVGLLWAAWQPRRAAGLLPMAAALAGALLVTGLLDVAHGEAPFSGEAHHLLDLAGLGLLWALVHPPRPSTPAEHGGVLAA